MARSVLYRERTIRSGTKVRTGCATCRIRKVKCDENKPFCQKCVTTGRTCGGYKSPFRLCTNQATQNAHALRVKLDVKSQLMRFTLAEITPQDVELLERCFSIKTIFDVKLGCDEEARQILQASLTDSHIRHAVSSLRALREDLETSEDDSANVSYRRSGYKYGLQQYSMALSGLASDMSYPGSNELRSALLCCQVFISIEKVQGNYAAMAQHIIRGLMIMHECGPRPYLTGASKLVPVHHDQLPLLDVFIIKLFAAPCKFVDPSMVAIASEMALPMSRPVESRHLRTIAPNMRTELERIAASTIVFLSKVMQIASAEDALELLSEKVTLLNGLESWLLGLELIQKEIRPPGLEPISMSFMRCFHVILKIVLLGALESSPDLHDELQTENDRLQSIANSLTERLRDYRICIGSSNGRGK